MAVVIVNPSLVEIDGVNYGAVADAIANNPQLASAIQIALNEWGTDIPGLRSRITQLEQELEQYRKPPQPDRSYKGLYKALIGEEGISLFLHIRYVASIDKDVNLAYVDTMSALVVGMLELPAEDTQLQSCVNALFASMSAVDVEQGGGFNEDEINLMRSLLDKHGFGSIVFPLGLQEGN